MNHIIILLILLRCLANTPHVINNSRIERYHALRPCASFNITGDTTIIQGRDKRTLSFPEAVSSALVMIRQRLAEKANKPVFIFIKGNPATGKTTLVNSLVFSLVNVYRYRVGVVEERELRREYRYSAEKTRAFLFKDASDMYPNANIIIIEGVKNLVPQDTENLDIFIKTTITDEAERIRRLEERENLDFRGLAKQGIELSYTLKQVKESPDYADRVPDIIVDNTEHSRNLHILSSLEHDLIFKTSSAGGRAVSGKVMPIVVGGVTLPDVELYLAKLNPAQKRALGKIEDEKHQIKREIKGRDRLIISRMGKDFNEVYWIQGTMLVEKKLRHNLDISGIHDTLEIAMSRLRGIGAKTYLYHDRLIQEYVEPLLRHKDEGHAHGLLMRLNTDEARKAIDGYFNLLYSLFERGVFDIDFNMFNCGRNIAGDIVIFDFGAITVDYPDNFELSRIRMALRMELRYLSQILPRAVWIYYAQKLEEFCGDDTAYNNIHRNFYTNIPFESWAKAQQKKRKRLGLPHPYPLKLLAGAKSSSAGYVKDIDQLKEPQLVSYNTTANIDGKIGISENDYSYEKYPDAHQGLKNHDKYHSKIAPDIQIIRAIKAIKCAA
jgi:tRNA A37 threonylcarbamoyladenosine biosynthesis protein TsaE